MKLLITGFRLGVMVATVGLFVGAILGVIGGLVTSDTLALTAFMANAYLFMAVGLPVWFYVNLLYNPNEQKDLPHTLNNIYVIAVFVWVIGLVLGTVFYMMPVTMIPIIFGQGVGINTSDDWYREAGAAIVGWRVIVVAVLTLVGHYVVANSVKPRSLETTER